MEEAAHVAMQTVLDTADDLRSVDRIRVVLVHEAALRIHEDALQRRRSDSG